MLGASCRLVLLVGDASPALAAGLAARGIAVRVAPAIAKADELLDAIVLVDTPREPSAVDAALAQAHSRLAEKGRIVVVPPSGFEHRLTVALSEQRFAILRQEPGVLVARRDVFTIREYRPGDEAQILAIFEGSFFVRRSRERWSWEYERNPYGNLTISEAFNEASELVAHYAGYPVRWRRDGASEPLMALQVGDTMTHPSIRHIGRGPTSLLGRTVRHFYARFCEGRVAFNYGFNTGNIQRFSMAFVGARRLEDLPFHVLDVGRALRARSRLRGWLGGWRELRVQRFDSRWDELFERVAPSYGMLVERDARYLSWRYQECPDPGYVVSAGFRRGRLVGWGAFRRRENRLLWGDGLFDPGSPQAVSRVLAHALSLPEHAGVRTVETWATSRPAWWRSLVMEQGFEAKPEPNGLALVFVPFEVDPETEMRERLYYTMGDSDLF
jgi:hypothetical protein